MTELQQNRYDRLLRRVGGLIGAKSMVNDALGELFPIIDVENLPGELLALMGTQLGWCSSILTPNVGDSNHHQLFNPPTSQNLLVVTQIAFSTTAATMVFRFSTFIGEQTVLVGNERRRDTREGTLAGLVAQNRSEQSAVSGGLDFRVLALVNETQFVKDPNGVVVLFPGTGLTVSTEAINTQSMVSFMWRERPFEESEQIDSG